MYEGPHKPQNIDEFMVELSNEMTDLILNGLNGVEINRGNFIMDAPARSLILDTKQPPGYFSCHKCWIKGAYDKRLRTISFLGTGNKLRTHDEFVAKQQFEVDANKTENHHVSGFQTAIEKIPTIDVVQNNPVDYMHSTCLGLMKRLLEIWIKISPSFRESVDSLIDKLQKCWPSEFQRKIRSIKFIKNYKATEYRFWLLYVAPALMKHFLSEEQYNHFTLVHHGVRLLFLHPIPSQENVNLSKECIIKFLNEWPLIYNESALTYVIHVLEHLPDDCLYNNSTPDSFSAFPFENYLRRVKRNYHSGGRQLEQVNIDYLFKNIFYPIS